MSTGVHTMNAGATPRFSSTLSRVAGCLLDVLRQLQKQFAKVHIRQNKKRLRVCETVQLGEKRIVAVIQVDDKQFLVGGGSNSLALLAELEKPAEFSTALHSRIAEVNASA